MGVKLKPILVFRESDLKSYNSRVIAFDAFNMLYQFLSSVRQYDGSYLMDSKGRITSHLSGIFYRMTSLMSNGIRPVFVFDGIAPAFKKREQEERREKKREAAEKYEKALEKGDYEAAASYASQVSYLTKDMIESAKKLLELMGIPVVQARSEAEAQAAAMCSRGIVDFVASQDFDSLLFGSPKLVRNLSLTEKRKLPGKRAVVSTAIEEYSLKENLESLGLTREGLVVIGMLVGTDFNDGVRGIGPKKALREVKAIGWEKAMEKYSLPAEVFEFFMSPPYREVELEFRKPDWGKVKEYLCGEYEFSEARVDKAIEKASAEKDESLSSFIL